MPVFLRQVDLLKDEYADQFLHNCEFENLSSPPNWSGKVIRYQEFSQLR